MRVVTLGALGQDSGCDAVRRRQLQLIRSGRGGVQGLGGLGHVPARTISEGRDYLEVIIERYLAHRVVPTGEVIPESAHILKIYDDIRVALMTILVETGDVALPPDLRAAIRKFDNAVYMATGQWYNVPWIRWTAIGVAAAGALGAWWLLKNR